MPSVENPNAESQRAGQGFTPPMSEMRLCRLDRQRDGGIGIVELVEVGGQTLAAHHATATALPQA